MSQVKCQPYQWCIVEGLFKMTGQIPDLLWGAVCNIHTFVDRSKFCPTKVTFVQQKSLLSDKSNFVYDKITFV